MRRLSFFLCVVISIFLTGIAQDAKAQGICSRTFAVQQAILSILPPFFNCSTVTDDWLAAITELNIDDEGVVILRDNDFAGMSGLKKLDVNFTSLTDLPEGIFSGLTSLERLRMIENSFSTLPADLFDGLSSLKFLILVDNGLDFLPADLFDGLSNLEQLDLRDNSLTDIDANLFSSLSSLKHVDIAENSITELDATIFSGLSNLERIEMNDNFLTELDATIFSGLTKLNGLIIDNNNVSILDAGLFSDLTNLGTLGLDDNSLTALPPNLFNGLSRLGFLGLENNPITELDPDIFDGLANLEILDLGDASLTTLPESIFDDQVEMYLILSGNPIRCLPQKLLDREVNDDRFWIVADDVIQSCEELYPKVILSLSPPTISEVDQMTTVTASLSEVSGEVTTITLTAVPESPATDSDFNLSATTLMIAAGAIISTETVTITSVDNDLYSGDKTIQVGGSAENTEGVTNPPNVPLRITDDEDVPTVTLTILPIEVSEDNGSTTITVTATPDAVLGIDLDVTVSVESGTATSGTDFDDVSPFFLTIAAGEMEGATTFSFVPIPDNENESDETVLIKGSSTLGDAIQATLTLTNAAPPPVVTLELSESTISEGEVTSLKARLSAPSNAETTIEVTVDPDSPATDNDYTLSTRTLTIAAGQTESTGQATIMAVDNNVFGEDKTFQIRGSATNLRSGVTGPENVILTIIDDDGFTLSVDPIVVREDAVTTDIEVTVILDTVQEINTEVGISVESGTATAGADFEPVPRFVLTILASESTGVRRFPFVPIYDDNGDEGDETVLITAVSSLGSSDQATLTITNAAPPSMVSLELEPERISEDGGRARVTASLSPASTAETTVEVTVTPDSPATEDDYELSSTTLLRILPGETRSTAAVTITAKNNEVDGPDKTLQVTGVATSLENVVSPSPKTLKIEDDDTAEEVTLTISPEAVQEDAGIALITVTAELDVLRSEDTRVNVSVTEGTAMLGADFATVPPLIMTIDANETVATGTLSFTPIEDEIHEPDETVQVTGTMSVDGLMVTSTELTIQDATPTPQVTLELSESEIPEAGGSSTVTATLSPVSSSVTTITVSVVPDSPATPSDYNLSTNRTLTIPPGATESTGLVTITANDNPVDTPHKTVQVKGRAMNDPPVMDPADQTLTITDDDMPTGFTLSISPEEVGENEGEVQITVTAELDIPGSTPTQVTLAVGDGTAMSGEDFSAVEELTFMIPATVREGSTTFMFTPNEDNIDESAETVLITGRSTVGNAQAILTITDTTPTPEVTLVLNPTSIQENGGSTTVMARLSAPSGEQTVLTISADPNSPATDEDYMLSENTTLSIAAGATESTGVVTITAIDNAIDAPDKTVRVQGNARNDNGVTGPSVQTLTITDEDQASGIELAVTPSSNVSEDDGTTQITATATVDIVRSVDTEVMISVESSTAILGTDFSPVDPFSMTIPANATKGTERFEFTPLPDDLHEPPETINVTGTSTLAPVAPATLTLFDSNLTPEVILELVPSVIEEEDGESRISARLTGKSSEVTVITVLASHDLPVTDEDYVLSPARTLTIAAEEFTSTGAVVIMAVDNAIDAPDKSVTVSGTATNKSGVTGPAEQTLTITDDDEASGITLAITPTEVGEDDGSQDITVTAMLEGARRSDPTVVMVMVEDETAEVGTDYKSVDSFDLTIPANAAEGTGTFRFMPIADEIHEPEETVQVTGRSSLGAATSASLMIQDADSAPTLILKLMSVSISEDGESTTVMATLDAPSGVETVINVSAFPQLPATTGDYMLSENTTLTIPPGELASRGVVMITAVDNKVSSSEDKMLTVSGQASNTLGVVDPEDVMLTITDDEGSIGLMLTVDPPEVTESEETKKITIQAILETARDTNTEVTITVENGTALAGQDYIPFPTVPLTIPAGETEEMESIELILLDDFFYEPAETIFLIGTSEALGTVETSLTIVDDDPRVTLAIQDTTVQEDNEKPEVRIMVTPAATTELMVRYQTIEQSATEGEDYMAVNDIHTIPAGRESVFIEIPITNDDLSEEDETFRIQLSDPTGAVLERNQATVTIEDDDVYRLRVEDASAQESDPEMIFMVTLDPPNPAQTVRVRYETLDGSAIAGVDYMSQSEMLEFMPNMSSREIRVPLVPDDDQEEMDKYFFLRLSEPEHAVLESDQVRGTIQDDDGPPVVNITPLVMVQENEGTASFEVTLEGTLPDRAVVVDFVVTEETAQASLDYVQGTRSPLRFSAGQSMHSIEVEIKDDNLFEEEETFRVQLTGAQNGMLGQSSGRGVIQDDEVPVTVNIQDVAISESEPEVTLQVKLSGPYGRPQTFNYRTEDGTAEAGDDYTAVTGTVTIPAGALEGMIRVPILEDQESEDSEAFQVHLSGEDMEDVTTAQVTILDNEGALTVDLDDARASEGDGAILLPIRLSRPSLQAVMVEFASDNQTAIAGSDYVSSKGIVIFEAGSTNGKIRIQILEDTEEEPEETFAVTLSNARHAALGKGTGIGTIVDNDGGSNVSVQSVTVSRSAAIFEMNLSSPSTLPVLVSYATEDGTALAGEDYEPIADQVTFAPGEVSKTVDVKLLSGERIWEAKTFALVVLSAVNAEVTQARTEAVMEEESEESIQNAYVARVLRTWASQLVDGLSRRMEGMAQCQIPDLTWLRDGRARWSLGEIFRGCGAEFTQGGWSVWGQGAYSRMRGQDGALSLRSDVTTMLLGADYAWDQGWMAGLVAAQSWDQGTYETPARAGTASSRLTGFYPYVSYQTGAGMRAWMLLGLGRGESELEALETELDAALVALGLTGTLTGSTTGRLGYEVDAFWATADMETGTDLGVRRVRAGVEGSLRLGAGMEPYLETALRQDGGDAETGLGIELGGGMRWSASQLRAEVGGRTLVLHTDEGLREWGLMGSVEYGTPGGLGPSMRVRPLWGNVYGGDLWREAPLHTMGVGSADQRVEMELGYGAPIQKSIGQSIVGMTVDPSGRAYRVGYNLRMRQGLQVSVATTARTMEENEAPPSYGLSARMDLKW